MLHSAVSHANCMVYCYTLCDMPREVRSWLLWYCKSWTVTSIIKLKLTFYFFHWDINVGFLQQPELVLLSTFFNAQMKLQFATSTESLDERVSILDRGRWNLKFLNICVKPHFRFRTITIKDLNILFCPCFMHPSPSIFVHDFNILTPGEAAHSPGRQWRAWRRGLVSDVSGDVSPGWRVLGCSAWSHGHQR